MVARIIDDMSTELLYFPPKANVNPTDEIKKTIKILEASLKLEVARQPDAVRVMAFQAAMRLISCSAGMEMKSVLGAMGRKL